MKTRSGGSIWRIACLALLCTLAGSLMRPAPSARADGVYQRYLPLAHSQLSQRVPNDPLFAQQWALRALKLPEAWPYTTGAPGTVVGLISFGIEKNHPEFAGRLIFGRHADLNTVPNGDNCVVGTHLAGIVAAAGDDGRGVAGMSWRTRLLAPVTDHDCVFISPAMSQIMLWAIEDGADILLVPYPTALTISLQSATQAAQAQDILVVAAAGEFKTPAGATEAQYPTGFTRVLGVTAIDADNQHIANVVTNAAVDVAAPGQAILSTWVNGQYATCPPDPAIPPARPQCSPSAQASAFVAGLAALVRAYHPEYSSEQIAQAILCNADDLGDPGRDDVYGYGRINAWRTLRNGAPAVNCADDW